MEIKRIKIGGNREEINKETGKHTPNFIEIVKRSDLIFTPEKLFQKLFKGNSQEYNDWLSKHKLHPSQVNYHNINQKQDLLKRLKVYTLRLLDEAKIDSMFPNELGNIVVTKWLETFDTLENHVYDLSDFDKVEFLKISDEFKNKFTTNSPFAFLTIDEVNQQIKTVESHKVLLFMDKKLPMGIKRGTPVGQEPEKLYQNFFTTIGYKGKGALTEGLNHHRTSFKNFNFNVNIETKLLNDIIYDVLKYNRKETQIAFIFGVYGKKLYFESDIKGTERKKEELDALAIVEGATMVIGKELHKERQGSIAVDQTTVEVQKRIEYPSVIIRSEKIDEERKTEVKQDRVAKIQKETKLEKEEVTASISSTLEAFEKEMFIRQQGYAELAKERINEALVNREQYVNEFYAFLKKGMSIRDALNKFSERYANNPYIKGIIETSITGQLQLQAMKDKGIEELLYQISSFRSEIQGLKEDLGVRETEIASVNQNIESLVVSHSKQLEEIEVNVSKLVEERIEFIERDHKQSEMIEELEKLIVTYEETLRVKDRDISEVKENFLSLEKENKLIYKEKKKQTELFDVIKSSLLESNREVENLENDKKLLSQKIENYDVEVKHYSRQIEHLKEENSLSLSANGLLKMSNEQLELQLESLVKNRQALEVENKEQKKINEELSKKKKLLQEELRHILENKESSPENAVVAKR